MHGNQTEPGRAVALPPADRLPDAHLPPLDPGLTVLEAPGPRSTALHRLALDALADAGRAYWVDTGSTASTHVLCDLAPSRRSLADLRVARAFTAYQHHALVRRVVRRASPRTGLVVAPNLASLYRDDDVPDHEAEALLGAAVDALSELGRCLDLPVLVTDAGGRADGRGGVEDGGAATAGDALGRTVRDAADAAIRCEATDEGLRYDADGFETSGYRGVDDRGLAYWQTTVPYWVDRCGAVAGPLWGSAAPDAEGLVGVDLERDGAADVEGDARVAVTQGA